MSLATKEAILRAYERVKRDKISFYKAAKLENVSLRTIYRFTKEMKKRKTKNNKSMFLFT